MKNGIFNEPQSLPLLYINLNTKIWAVLWRQGPLLSSTKAQTSPPFHSESAVQSVSNVCNFMITSTLSIESVYTKITAYHLILFRMGMIWGITLRLRCLSYPTFFASWELQYICFNIHITGWALTFNNVTYAAPPKFWGTKFVSPHFGAEGMVLK